MPVPRVEDLLRELAPRVLGVLVRRYGQFDRCEDAVQEALLAAAQQWPAEGVPASPMAWLTTVARRRMADQIRSDQARRQREDTVARQSGPDDAAAGGAVPAAPAVPGVADDTLTLLFLCCHPALSPASQLALTLRAVGGLTTAEIARGFLVPEATMAQRISRAKQSVKAAGASFAPPPEAERAERLGVVLHVLYLIFNEGYTTSSGPDLARTDLTAEAIRLTRAVHDLVPPDDPLLGDGLGNMDGEVTGLLALMVLTDARRPARTRPDGTLVPLAEQDRALWDRAAIAEGLALVADVLPRARLGPYQVQAAIAAVHAEAPSADETDWGQILMLYEILDRMAPNPMVTLNRAVAKAMVHGPQAGLDLLAPLDDDPRTARHHRLAAVRGHLLEMAGDIEGARASYRRAARATTSLPEQRYLDGRAAGLSG